MSIVESIVHFLKHKESKDAPKAPEGLCPNCWGREEYGGHFYNVVKQENLDVNSDDSNVGWIAAYANKHLAGITMQRKGNGAELVCGKCNISYQDADKHSK